jgi:hypothetical protein
VRWRERGGREGGGRERERELDNGLSLPPLRSSLSRNGLKSASGVVQRCMMANREHHENIQPKKIEQNGDGRSLSSVSSVVFFISLVLSLSLQVIRS